MRAFDPEPTEAVQGFRTATLIPDPYFAGRNFLF
jgi:hypothetical protein